MVLEVWGRRNSINVAPVMWAIGELDLPHVRHDVGGSFSGLDTPAYQAMNPNRKIPTINDDGFVLWESNAIVRYLAARHGAGSLSPDHVTDHARADQWMEWYKTTLFPDYVRLFLATVRTEPTERDPATIAALARSLGTSLEILDRQLARHQYLIGDRLTMADIPFGPTIHRYFQLAVERPTLPHLAAWHERLSTRSAYREHVMFPFGSTPLEWTALERAGARKR